VRYSDRLGDLTDAELQAAAAECGLGRLAWSAPVSTGLFGRNLLFGTDQGEYVLRGRPHYDWQLPTEAYFAQAMQDATRAPVPWPYLVRPDSRVFDWPWGYAVMPRLPGLSLAEVHRLTHPVAGRYDPRTGTIAAFAGGYRQRTVDQIETAAARARGHGAHSGQEQLWLRELVTTLSDGAEAAVFTAVMEDDNRNNMTAGVGPGAVTVTGRARARRGGGPPCAALPGRRPAAGLGVLSPAGTRGRPLACGGQACVLAYAVPGGLPVGADSSGLTWWIRAPSRTCTRIHASKGEPSSRAQCA
jgi:hypothetical protein